MCILLNNKLDGWLCVFKSQCAATHMLSPVSSFPKLSSTNHNVFTVQNRNLLQKLLKWSVLKQSNVCEQFDANNIPDTQEDAACMHHAATCSALPVAMQIRIFMLAYSCHRLPTECLSVCAMNVGIACRQQLAC